MKYYTEKGDTTLIVVFHGTGGDEHDLIQLVRLLHPTAFLLSLRGEVEEQGMLRFFKRLSPGVFDEENVREEAAKIKTFLADKLVEYSRVIFLGYSNGANMIGVLLQLYPSLVSEAVLLHPMQVLADPVSSSARVAITYGLHDTMIPASASKRYADFLQNQGCIVTTLAFESGHEVTQKEIEQVAAYLHNA